MCSNPASVTLVSPSDSRWSYCQPSEMFHANISHVRLGQAEFLEVRQPLDVSQPGVGYVVEPQPKASKLC